MAEDTIAVAIRVRPVIAREKKQHLQEQWTISENDIYLTNSNSYSGNPEVFTFDYILDTTSDNRNLYNVVQPLVHSALNGFNATIFAYGQTSSGKTHSIMGNDCDPGIIPLAVHDMFATIENNTNNKYILRLAYLEIYNEKINDLLKIHNKDLKIREDTSGNRFVESHEAIVRDEGEMLSVIQSGNKNRKIGDTKMNELSSRSHVICHIIIESYELNDSENVNVDNTPVKVSHLYFIDLAGSERISQTKATGIRLNEGVSINQSLSTLISVITQLSNGQPFVNFRDSKLTQLLSNALGGNSRTLIVANITPVSVEDSLSTLKFARRAKTIKTKPRVNEMKSEHSIIKQQQFREKALLVELERERTKNLESLNMRDDTIKRLEAELEEIHNKFVTRKDKTLSRFPKRRHTMAGVLPKLEIPLSPILEQSICELTDNTNSTNDDRQIKLFTQQELQIIVEERIKDLRFQLATLKQQNERSQSEEFIILKEKYEHLDMSHVQLKEFTKLELDVEVEVRTHALQEIISKLNQQNMILQAEIDVISTSQQQQHTRRCNELLSRIEELEKGKPSNIASEFTTLQEKCNKLEGTVKLAEMRSKVLLRENAALKQPLQQNLARSHTEPNLLIKAEDGPNKEIFQDLFKSLRQLCSTIIGESKDTSSFVDKLSMKIDEETSETKEIDAQREISSLKQDINVLMEKLKASNDRLNARDRELEEKLKINLEKNDELLKQKEELVKEMNRKLNNLSKDYNIALKQKEELVEEMNRKLNNLSKDYNIALKQKEELVEEMNRKLNNLSKDYNITLNTNRELNEQMKVTRTEIKNLEEKLKHDNDEVSKRKDNCIMELDEKLKQQLYKQKLDAEAFETVSKENEDALIKISQLESAVQIVDLQRKREADEHINKLNQVTDQHLQLIVDMQNELAVNRNILIQKDSKINQLNEELKEKCHKLTLDAKIYKNLEKEYEQIKVANDQHKLEITRFNQGYKPELNELKKQLNVAEEKHKSDLDGLNQQLEVANQLNKQLKIAEETRKSEIKALNQQLEIAEEKLKSEIQVSKIHYQATIYKSDIAVLKRAPQSQDTNTEVIEDLCKKQKLVTELREELKISNKSLKDTESCLKKLKEELNLERHKQKLALFAKEQNEKSCSSSNELEQLKSANLKIHTLQKFKIDCNKQIDALRKTNEVLRQQSENDKENLGKYQQKESSHKQELERLMNRYEEEKNRLIEGLHSMNEKQRLLQVQIDETFTNIPRKLFILKTIGSNKLLNPRDVCQRCDRISTHLKLLHSTCCDHPAWLHFGAIVDQSNIISSERFKLLMDARDILKLVYSPIMDQDLKVQIERKLVEYNKEIDTHLEKSREKGQYLKFVYEELGKARSAITEEYKIDTEPKNYCSYCTLCQYYTNIVDYLKDSIMLTIRIIDSTYQSLQPMEYCCTNLKLCDDKLEQLMVQIQDYANNKPGVKEELERWKEKYRKAKTLAELRYEDVLLMKEVLLKDNYEINFKVNPITIIKKPPRSIPDVEENNPRPVFERQRDNNSGRKSLGTTPKHLGPIFGTPEELRMASRNTRKPK